MEHPRGPHERRSSLRLVDPGAGQEGGPAWGQTWGPDPADEEFDALTDLFIGDPADSGADGLDPAEAPGREPGARATLEAIITGHLPVRGTVWVRAYAAMVAREAGEPVALVRISPDRTAVELIGSSADADPIPDIHAAIEAARSATDAWLLHFDEIDQAGLLRSRQIDRFTVLSGADEPAIVSAYRLFKSMLDLGEDAARAGVSIVGSGQIETDRAAARITGAVRQFLGVALEPRPSVPRVESARVALLGDCGSRIEPAEVLDMIRAADGREPVVEEIKPRVVEPAMAAPIAGATRPADSADADSVDTPGDLPDPADLVPDLRALGLPCPVAPAVSMAADTAGRLHLLAWWSPDAPADLLKAAAWARVNLPLLARVCPGLCAEPCAPAQHLVCVDLAVAADLRGTNTIVHLAHPVDHRPVSGWVCGRVN